MQERINAMSDVVEKAERGEAVGDTALRLLSVERAVTDQAEQASALIAEFFEYQQKFEVRTTPDEVPYTSTAAGYLTRSAS